MNAPVIETPVLQWRGRARLVKHVVTEDVTITVPVQREEVRIEREPITDANRGDATAGGEITSEEHEVTDEQQVTEQVRKERIETEGVEPRR